MKRAYLSGAFETGLVRGQLPGTIQVGPGRFVDAAYAKKAGIRPYALSAAAKAAATRETPNKAPSAPTPAPRSIRESDVPSSVRSEIEQAAIAKYRDQVFRKAGKRGVDWLVIQELLAT